MSEFNDKSLYINTPTNKFTRGYYEPIGIKKDDSDMYVLITDEYNCKPGKLALLLYGDARLSWVFSYFNRNKITDPIFDLKSGIILRCPTKERLLSYF